MPGKDDQGPVHTQAHLHANLCANPLMLLASCVNTPIDHNVFHYLHMPVARCSVPCVNWALGVNEVSSQIVLVRRRRRSRSKRRACEAILPKRTTATGFLEHSKIVFGKTNLGISPSCER